MNVHNVLRRLSAHLLCAGLIAGLATVSVAVLPASASGTTLYAAAPRAQGTGDCSTPANACTLTTALNDVVSGGTIELVTPGTTALYRGVFNVNTSVTIVPAPGVTNPTLDGGGISRVFYVSFFDDLQISGVTIQNGNGVGNAYGEGGGIYVDYGGQLTVTDSTLTGNEGYWGGAISTQGGTVTVTDSTITGNYAAYGGAIFDFPGTVTVTDSTIAGNYGGPIQAGGIYNLYGSLTVGATLFANNDLAAKFSVGGPIVAGGGGDCTSINYEGPYLVGSFNDEGYNLIDDTTTGSPPCVFTASTDVYAATNAVELGVLGNNGGPTQTMLPAPNSPAVGVIPTGTTLNSISVCSRTDQRGFASVGNCTIGAVEGGVCAAGLTARVLNATYATGTFIGLFCVNANGDGTYAQWSPALPVTEQALTGTGHIRVNQGTTTVQANLPAFKNLNLVGSTNGTVSSFGESGSGFPTLHGTFTLS